MPEIDRRVLIGVGIVVGIGALLLVILLPMSFVTLEYYEMGFKRQKSTGTVDSNTVYTGGKYLLGPDAEFKIFKAGAHFLDLRDVAVFTADKLEVKITCHIQYFLRADELPLLHRKFDIYYENVMQTSAIDAIKGAIPVYNTRQLVSQRGQIEMVLWKRIRSRLGGTCCRPNCDEYVLACPDKCKTGDECTDELKGLFVDVKYFQLTSIDIPSTVEERFMETLVLTEKELREQLYQNATLIREKTVAMVKAIQNDATEIRESANAEKAKIATVAQAEYTNTIEKARSTGLKNLYSSLGITNQDQKNSFDYLRTLRGLDNVHLTVDFQQRIAGNL